MGLSLCLKGDFFHLYRKNDIEKIYKYSPFTEHAFYFIIDLRNTATESVWGI